MADSESPHQRRRRRRVFAAQLAPIVLVLAAVGAVFADETGAMGLVGDVALAQAIGLAVAALYLALGHNPLSKP